MLAFMWRRTDVACSKECHEATTEVLVNDVSEAMSGKMRGGRREVKVMASRNSDPDPKHLSLASPHSGRNEEKPKY